MKTEEISSVGEMFSSALAQPESTIEYSMSKALHEAFPTSHILATGQSGFQLYRLLYGEFCTGHLREDVHSIIHHGWRQNYGLWASPSSCWYDVKWDEYRFEVVVLEWPGDCGNQSRTWIIGESTETVQRFFVAACEWCAQIRNEVLVFSEGNWSFNEELYESIQSARFDNLILPSELTTEIRQEVRNFLGSKSVYEEYSVPWKRGIIFIGPPGNGKTHAVKSIINDSRLPALYVRSFTAHYGSDQSCMRMAFEKARETAPCLFILEDIDSLVTERNRSFFLNELDGFAANAGIFTLATTNHPEKLDAAIVDRPSRFDRKYHFELPGPTERQAYVFLWNDKLSEKLRLSDGGISTVTERTDGFSFAYIKELFLSSMMQWVNASASGSMDDVMPAQADNLRQQMATHPAEVEVFPESSSRYEEDYD